MVVYVLRSMIPTNTNIKNGIRAKFIGQFLLFVYCYKAFQLNLFNTCCFQKLFLLQNFTVEFFSPSFSPENGTSQKHQTSMEGEKGPKNLKLVIRKSTISRLDKAIEPQDWSHHLGTTSWKTLQHAKERERNPDFDAKQASIKIKTQPQKIKITKTNEKQELSPISC